MLNATYFMDCYAHLFLMFNICRIKWLLTIKRQVIVSRVKAKFYCHFGYQNIIFIVYVLVSNCVTFIIILDTKILQR